MKMLNVGELKYIFLCLCLFFVFLFSFYFIWKNTFYLSFLGKFTKTEETSVSVVSNLSKQVHFLVHTRVWYKSVVFLIDQVLLIITNQGAAVQLKCLQQFEDEFIVLFSNHPPPPKLHSSLELVFRWMFCKFGLFPLYVLFLSKGRK